MRREKRVIARRPRLLKSPVLWAAGSLVLATLASLLLVIVPTYEGGCIGVAEYGAGGTNCPLGVSHTTLLEENGPGVLWVLAAPVALAALGVLLCARGARVVAAVALGAFSLLTGFSIGGAYLPATLAMAFAAWRTRRHPRTDAAHTP